MNTCPKCGQQSIWKECSYCEVSSWTPEKRKAIARLISLVLRKSNGEDVTDEQLGGAVDDALKHIPENGTPDSPAPPAKGGA